MPLIVVAGRPCVGKTRFAEDLVDFLSTRGDVSAVLVNVEALGISAATAYSGARRRATFAKSKAYAHIAHNVQTLPLRSRQEELSCQKLTGSCPAVPLWFWMR